MFSMKPKFDLAAFLKVPAPVGAARSRAAKYRTMAARPAEPVETASTPAPSADPAKTD
jgi:hypothetical protein